MGKEDLKFQFGNSRQTAPNGRAAGRIWLRNISCKAHKDFHKKSQSLCVLSVFLANFVRNETVFRITPVFIFLSIFLFIPFGLFAQQDSTESQLPIVIANDSTVVDVRKFDEATLEKLKTDPSLDYGTGPAAMSIWERIKQWLAEFFSYLFEAGASANWVEILIYVALVLILGYVILWLLKIDAVKMFFSNKAVNPIKSVVLEENIHEVDFEKRIKDALAKLEYREATRLLFLHALKILSDKDLIHWEPGKTNHDYINELESEKLKPGFNDLNYFFEYAWYGHFEVNESVFTKAQNTFNNWRGQAN